MALVVLGFLALGGATAYSHTAATDARVTIRYNDDKDRFQGRVRSEREACERKRTVYVLKERRNRPPAGRGATRTNREGFWKIENENPRGRFFAVVQRRIRGNRDHLHTCRGRRSETIRVS
jgi:hypothetical protein